MIRTQTKTIIDSLQNKLHDTIYENAKLRAQLFDTISDQKDTLRGTSANTKFAKQSILGKPPKVGKTHALSKLVTSNSIPTPQGSKVVKNVKVVAPGMFRINPFKPSREEKHVPNKVRASVRINPITVSQHPVITKKVVNSDSNGLSSTGFFGTVRFGNDHVTTILGFDDLHWGNILITKEHLCPSCEQGKSKRASHLPKPVPNSRQKLQLLHMDLCGPMRIASINGKRFVLVIVDDYSRYTWVQFLRSKDEAPKVIKTFLKRISILLQSPVIIIRTDNGTKFKNQVLKEYFDSFGISHQVSSVRTPQQNGVVERRNWTLIEAARTMLIFSRAPLFLWAEAIATACFTQNRSIIHRCFYKTPYELINGTKLDISFLHVFEALCYPKNDREDIGKLGAKGVIGFFIGYSADSCAFRVYNQRTKKIMETKNVTFDELSAMAFEQRSSKPGLQSMSSGQINSGLDLTYALLTITT
nr:retrovirus-related Pol polyprotein from transposon TNT 1-94 [Tanacetum cinerariifolium]